MQVDAWIHLESTCAHRTKVVLNLRVLRRLILDTLNHRYEVLQLLIALLFHNVLALHYPNDLLQKWLLKVCPMVLAPSLEQEGEEALDHDGLVREQVLHFVQRDVVWVAWCTEALRDKVIRRVKARRLHEQRKVTGLHLELFDDLHCTLHVLHLHENVDEHLLKFWLALDESFDCAHVTVILLKYAN